MNLILMKLFRFDIFNYNNLKQRLRAITLKHLKLYCRNSKYTLNKMQNIQKKKKYWLYIYLKFMDQFIIYHLYIYFISFSFVKIKKFFL